jgi:hypothetical protein
MTLKPANGLSPHLSQGRPLLELSLKAAPLIGQCLDLLLNQERDQQVVLALRLHKPQPGISQPALDNTRMPFQARPAAREGHSSRSVTEFDFSDVHPSS